MRLSLALMISVRGLRDHHKPLIHWGTSKAVAGGMPSSRQITPDRQGLRLRLKEVRWEARPPLIPAEQAARAICRRCARACSTPNM